TLLCAVTALLLFAGSAAAAEEIKGKLKKAGNDKITITVDEKDKTFDVSKDAKVVTLGKKKQLVDVTGGLKGLKEGDEVTLTTDKKEDKEVVTQVQVAGKKKKKAK